LSYRQLFVKQTTPGDSQQSTDHSNIININTNNEFNEKTRKINFLDGFISQEAAPFWIIGWAEKLMYLHEFLIFFNETTSIPWPVVRAIKRGIILYCS